MALKGEIIDHPKSQSDNRSHESNVTRARPPVEMGVSKVKLGFIFGIAVIAIGVGLTGGYFWSSIYDNIFTSELVLSPTSKSFSIWKETPIPMYMEIFMFNWTNPDEFNKTVKPHFNELGPYVFKEVDKKVIKSWNENSTITFEQNRSWQFMESMSRGTLDDRVTNLNPVVTTINYIVRDQITLVKKAADGIMKATKEKLTVTKTVRELIFEGYDDPILDLAEKTKMFKVPYDKFGWFYTRNNSDSYDGMFTMHTGQDDMSKMGILTAWNYMNHSAFYPDTCGQINGSLGDFWPPLTNIDVASVFAPDACTLVQLHYDKMVEFEGLTGKKFVGTSETFDNGTKVPSRACYCKNKTCYPSGVLEVSRCKFGAPAFLSSPHFYLADESYLNAVDGLNPSKERHEFSLVVEPIVGVPMQVQARLQLNLLIKEVEHIEIFKGLPEIFIPMLWFQQHANLTSTYSTPIKLLLILPTLGHVTLFGIAGIGCLLLVIGAVVIVRARRRAEDHQSLIAKAETSRAEPIVE